MEIVEKSSIETGMFRDLTIHASRTLMIEDLTLLLDAVPQGTYEDYRRAVIEDNVLRRRSASARAKTFGYLRSLYSLDDEDEVFAALRLLAGTYPESIPVLALLTGATRDALLRSTVEMVSRTPSGMRISAGDMRCEIESHFPDRYSENTLLETGRRILSSWTQAGYAEGRTVRTRRRAETSVGAVVFALYLGHLSGARGRLLFETFWAKSLDSSEGEMDSLAFAASRRGLIKYRRIGDVVEVGFPAFESVADGG